MHPAVGLAAGLELIEEFRKLNPEMPMQTAAMLLIIAQSPGITTRELMKRLNVAQATASRNAAVLGQVNRHGIPGLDLIVSTPDPQERRRNVYHLTPKGQKTVAGLTVRLKIWQKFEAAYAD